MRAFRLVVVLLIAGSITILRLHATDLESSERKLPQGVVARLGAPVRSSKHQAVAIAFSPDGTLLAADLGNKVEILRCSDGKSICHLQGEPATSPSERATALGFSPSGNRIASWNGSRRSLTWWSVPAGRQLRTAKVELVPEDKPREDPTHSDSGSNQSFSFSQNMASEQYPETVAWSQRSPCETL